MIPGEILPLEEAVELPHTGTPHRLTITNRGAAPVHLTAHFHVMEANKRLCFDRRKAFGMRLLVHAKGAVRFEPGEIREVEIVPIEGRRRVFGFSGAVDGALDDVDPETVLQGLIARGYCHLEDDAP